MYQTTYLYLFCEGKFDTIIFHSGRPGNVKGMKFNQKYGT